MFNKTASNSEKVTGNLDDAMRALSPSTLAAVAGVTSLVATIKGMTSAFKTAIGNFSHFEELEMGLTTFFHDADVGKAKFEELRKLSNETTFGVDELTGAFTQMANVGVDVDTIKDKLVMLGNVVQGDKNKFADLVTIYSKINSTGKASAMQLQQLAMRGVPIYDMLKKMGVTGTATAKDITKAFKNMTSAVDETTGKAGQFYNAMDNINKTIEGKEGFISDYFKEMTVNFAEVSGIADAYKAILDVLKEKIGNLSDKLLEWNSNPVMKALLQGGLVAVISSLVTVIGVGLVGAIIKLNTELKKTVVLKAILNPATLALAVGAGVIAGIAVAVKSYKKSTAEAAEETAKMAKAVEDAKKAMGTDYNLLNVGVNKNNRKQNLQNETAILDGYKSNLATFNEKLQEAHKNVSLLEEKMRKDGGGGLTGYEKKLKKAQEEVNKWQEAVAHTNRSIEEQARVVSFWESQVEKFNITELKDQVDELFNGTISKHEKEKIALEDNVKTVQAYEKKLKELNGQFDNDGNVISYAKNKPEIDKTIEYLNKQLKEVKIKIKLENLSEWQKVLQNAMGFTNEEVYDGAIEKGATAVAKFKEKLEKEMTNMKSFSDAGLINISKLDLAEQKLEKINSVIKAMRDSGLWGADEGTTNKMKDLQYSAQQEATIAQLESYREELAILKDQTGELKKQAEIKALMSEGYTENQAEALLYWEKQLTDEKKKQSDIWGYLEGQVSEYFEKIGISKTNADLFASTLMDIAKTQIPNALIDGFTAIGDALAKGASVGDALKKQFAQLVSQITKSLAITCIQAGVNLIAQSGWAGVPGALALFALGGASGIASGFISSLAEGSSEANEQEKQLELLKELNQQYKDLAKAIKEQEEYYLKKKSEINAFTLKDYVSRATPVNDMIITPKGNFSTHPEDTIIATKNPEGLGKGAVKVVVNNYANTDVDVQQRNNNGVNEMLITISKKIASDVANGFNGWDNAFAMQKQRVDGRRL
ncbi:hypothetical protein SAMN04487977_101461 [Treponema bryantii]|uniref:Tape measure domain-containing protein n=1 Tax=Treponema bryantii TaxID=163 RepID=A0A1H9ATV3_9SPIR|nr:hypothetical protein [Treponema bryantii]SEP79941.1 hypothetical protein SAMN04487977_101461 [Treponema bryantii]